MPIRPILPAILLALVMSIVVAVLAIGRESGAVLALAVGLFALQMLFAALRINAPYWRVNGDPPKQSTAVLCVRRNAILTAFVYAWGATALFATYSMSSLVWRHWWQYGAAMALVSLLLLLYAHLLLTGGPGLRAPRSLGFLTLLTVAQGLAVCGVLVYLVLSGKMMSPRGDWVANYIFAAGSATLALLSLIGLLTYRRLVRRGAG
jgi:hypothetical protein